MYGTTSGCGDDENFLGHVNYLNRFSPHLAELSEPLRQICRQNMEFELTEPIHVTFSLTKEEISKNVTLPYFNPNCSTTLQTNASKKGLGAVLLQNSKPVMFTSRALTGSEGNYQNLERVFGNNLGHGEIPLLSLWEGIHTGDQSKASSFHLQETHGGDFPRIQRLIVRNFPCEPFDVQYKKGVEIPLVDVLSRVTPTPVEEDGIQLPIVAVNLITSNLPVSSTEIELIHEETTKDPTLTLMRCYIHMGWPNDHRMLLQELHMFWNYREDLSMENGLITKGARLLIPSTLRKKVLEQIHNGHLGIEKCMLKARDCILARHFQ